VEGVLKGFDTLVNLVLDECVEFIRGASLLKPLQSPRRAPPPAWRRAPRAARRARRAPLTARARQMSTTRTS
jgi:small nuclear ribonucleoprotein (snRNP)-like protein